MEVEATVSNVIGLKDATSYGVELPDSDGMYSVNSTKHVLFHLQYNFIMLYYFVRIH